MYWASSRPEALRKEDGAILLALPLRNPHLTGLQVDICETEPDEFGIADAGDEERCD
jgi:hypothetical protein